MPSIEALVGYIGAAIVYSLVVWLPKRIRPGDAEVFDLRKFLKALVIGVVVGLYAYGAGLELSLMAFEDLMKASGAVLIAERAVTFLFRLLANLQSEKRTIEG